MHRHAEQTPKNTKITGRNTTQSVKHAVSSHHSRVESAFPWVDNRSETVQLKTFQGLINNRTQAIDVSQKTSGNDLGTKTSTIQLMKDRGNKLANKVGEAWSIDHLDARSFVSWCKDEGELNDWLDFNSFEDWQTLQQLRPNEHDPMAIAEVLESASKPKKAPAKQKAPEPTEEEKQIELAIAHEERLAQERSAAKETRQTDLSGFNLVPGESVTGDPVLQMVWSAILSEYVNRINQNLSISQSFTNEQLTTALEIWKSQTGTLRSNQNVTYVSTFNQVQDKSQRADGGTNSVNLVKRSNQANFIIEINGYRINAHVDQS